MSAASEIPNPPSLKAWVDGGHYMTFEDLQVFVHTSGPKSLDGRGVLIQREEKRVAPHSGFVTLSCSTARRKGPTISPQEVAQGVQPGTASQLAGLPPTGDRERLL